MVVTDDTFTAEVTGVLFCCDTFLGIEVAWDSISFASVVATALELLEPNSEVIDSLGPDCKALSKSNPARLVDSTVCFLTGFTVSFLASVSCRASALRCFELFIPDVLACLISDLTLETAAIAFFPTSTSIEWDAPFATAILENMNIVTAPPIPTIRMNMMKPPRPRIGTSPKTHSSEESPLEVIVESSNLIEVTIK